jgi:hypothetical protein
MTDFEPHPWHDQPNQKHDMLVGPCACGAWHERGEWVDGVPVLKTDVVRAAAEAVVIATMTAFEKAGLVDKLSPEERAKWAAVRHYVDHRVSEEE